MFWKKKIPAQQHERALLLHRLFHQRSENDSNAQVLAHFLGQSLDDIAPEELLVGTPESTILMIMEQFYQFRDQGATQEFALKTMNEMHATLLSAAGENLTQIARGSTLFQYVRHVVNTLHGHGDIQDDFIVDAIQQIKEFYRR